MDTQSPEIVSSIENRLAIEIAPASARDIDGLARVQWLARKQGVEQGYLPERVLGLHVGESSKEVSDELGIKYASGELIRFFMKNPREDDVILSARTNNITVGKVSIQVEKDSKIAELDRLEVLPEYQGRGVSLELSQSSVDYIRKNFLSIKTIRLGRYNASTTHAQTRYKPDSFFNVLMDKVASKSEETIDKTTSIIWIDLPIDAYEEEVQRRLERK